MSSRALEYDVAVLQSAVHLLPGHQRVPEASAANTINVSHRILAEVELTPDARG